jgi:hypothetical protein
MTALQSGFQGVSLCYAQVGQDIYFSSAQGVTGIIHQPEQSTSPWGSYGDIFYSPVPNPSPWLPSIAGKLLGAPLLASQLAYYNGRIYLAVGSVLWCTEPFAYNFVDRTRNFLQFEATIVLLGTVVDGLYVGTTEGVWFLQGRGFPMPRNRVMDSGVVPGSMVNIPKEIANPPQIGLQEDTPVSVSIAFMTQAGYCVASDGGEVTNFTEDKVIFPAMQSASAMFRRQSGINQYVVSGNSGGTPAANARIGDWCDVQLIKADAWRTQIDGLSFGDSCSAVVVT